MEDTKQQQEGLSRWSEFLLFIRSGLIPTAILAAIWLVLGWLYSAGIYSGFFKILDFLTGSVNGLFGSLIGGIVGRTLYAVCLHDLLRELLINKGSLGSRLKKFGASFKGDVLNYIPQYANVSYFYGEKDMELLGSGALGAGLALWIYPFITSTGSFVNCSVLILLFFAIIQDVATQGGLVKAGFRYLMAKKKFKHLREEAVDRVLIGFAIGCAASLVPALIKKIDEYAGGILWTVLTRVLPVILILAAVVMILLGKIKTWKEEA